MIKHFTEKHIEIRSKERTKRSRIDVGKMIQESINKEDRYADSVREYFGSDLESIMSPSTKFKSPSFQEKEEPKEARQNINSSFKPGLLSTLKREFKSADRNMGDFRVNLLQSYIEAKLGLGKKMTHLDLVIKKIGMDHEREHPTVEITEEK